MSSPVPWSGSLPLRWSFWDKGSSSKSTHQVRLEESGSCLLSRASGAAGLLRGSAESTGQWTPTLANVAPWPYWRHCWFRGTVAASSFCQQQWSCKRASPSNRPLYFFLSFPGIDPAHGCFPELAVLPNYLVRLRDYENAVICMRRGGKTERRKKLKKNIKEKMLNWQNSRVGDDILWGVSSPHTVCRAFWELSVWIVLENMESIIF